MDCNREIYAEGYNGAYVRVAPNASAAIVAALANGSKFETDGITINGYLAMESSGEIVGYILASLTRAWVPPMPLTEPFGG